MLTAIVCEYLNFINVETTNQCQHMGSELYQCRNNKPMSAHGLSTTNILAHWLSITVVKGRDQAPPQCSASLGTWPGCQSDLEDVFLKQTSTPKIMVLDCTACLPRLSS